MSYVWKCRSMKMSHYENIVRMKMSYVVKFYNLLYKNVVRHFHIFSYKYYRYHQIRQFHKLIKDMETSYLYQPFRCLDYQCQKSMNKLPYDISMQWIEQHTTFSIKSIICHDRFVFMYYLETLAILSLGCTVQARNSSLKELRRPLCEFSKPCCCHR